MAKKESKARSFLNKIQEEADEIKGVESSLSKEGETVLEHREKRAHSHAKEGKSKTKMITTMLVDPAKCRIWDRPNRIYGLLTPENCMELISTIEAQGQQIPAIARQTGDSKCPFEIVVGRRRHFCVTHLKKELLIDVRVLSDEEAFRISDADNDGRKDLSDYEKALDWEDAIKNFYGGKIERFATANSKDLSDVYRLMDLAELDEMIIGAYSSKLDIKKTHASKLKTLMKDHGAREKILEEAEKLTKEEGVSGANVFKRLAKAAAKKDHEGSDVMVEKVVCDKSGNKVFSFRMPSKGGCTIKIMPNLTVGNQELIDLIKKVVDGHI